MFLKELSNLHGVSGDETKVRNFIREKLFEMGLKILPTPWVIFCRQGGQKK